METQIAQLAASVPRQLGMLPGSTEPNPKGKSTGHVAAVKLRSGHQLREPEVGKQQDDTEQQLDVDKNLVDIENIIDVDNSSDRPTSALNSNSTSRKVVDVEELVDVEKSHVEIDKSATPPTSVLAPNQKKKLPFPTKSLKDPAEKKFQRFIKMLQKLNVTIPFTEALNEMPSYVKFLKEILSKKRSMAEIKEECSHLDILEKRPDPGKFAITIGFGPRLR